MFTAGEFVLYIIIMYLELSNLVGFEDIHVCTQMVEVCICTMYILYVLSAKSSK